MFVTAVKSGFANKGLQTDVTSCAVDLINWVNGSKLIRRTAVRSVITLTDYVSKVALVLVDVFAIHQVRVNCLAGVFPGHRHHRSVVPS